MPQTLSSGRFLKLSRIFAPVFIIAVLTVGIYGYIDNKLRVRVITVEGLPRNFKLYGLDSIKEARILFLEELRVETVIKDANPSVSDVAVRKSYPDALSIKITVSKPLLYFKADGGYFVLDEAGKIILKLKNIERDPELPVLHYFQRFNYAGVQPGESLNVKDIKMALVFVKKIRELGLQVITVDIDGVDMIGLNLNNKAILFSSEKDIESQIYQLEQIMHQFRIQGKEFKKLDLRFNRPVLELVE